MTQLSLFPDELEETQDVEMTEEEAKYQAANLIEEYLIAALPEDGKEDEQDLELKLEWKSIVKVLRG